MAQGLSPTDVVDVQVNLTPLPATFQNFGSLLIIGPTPNVISSGERIRQYSTLDQVVADFGTLAPEYLAASLFFGQTPQPALLFIGFWAQNPTSASLHGGTLLLADTVTSAWIGITTGSMRVTIDGTLRTLSNLNFSACTNMNAVAAVIQVGLGAGTTCIWNPGYSRFEIRSGSTGGTSTIGYASPTGSGFDISTKACLTQTLASPPTNGILAETPLACLAVLTSYGSWYGVMFAPTNFGDVTDSQFTLMAGFVEGASPPIIMGISSLAPQLLDPTVATDLGSTLSALEYTRTFIQYSSSNPYCTASFFGRAFTVNFLGSNTTITLKFKVEPGVIAETITETQAATLRAKNVNVFVNYSNGVAFLQEGVMCGGWFFDERHGLDWLANNVQVNNLNILLTYGKVPQTDAGMAIFRTVTESSLQDGVNNGLLAPGVWNAPGFGQLATGQMLPKGYYTYIPPMATQSETIRATRTAPQIQCAAKLAGAVHFSNVMINVNR